MHLPSLPPLHPLEESSPVDIAVDEALQEEFFQKIFSQLESIHRFYRMEESKLVFALSEIQEQVQMLCFPEGLT